MVFVWLRDREGLVQLVFDEAVCSHEVFELGRALRSEYVVTCTGEVRMPRRKRREPDLPTGKVEVFVRECELLNRSETPPSTSTTRPRKRDGAPHVPLPRPAQALFAAQSAHAREDRPRVRAYMDSQGFAEVETPVLTKSTPEGARDFLVPSRLHPGSFYALPQSPQIYKQLLMLAGFDKYYQLARCFRDEDNRADRQPEFTQVDVEMSFIDEKDIQTVIEGAFSACSTT